MHIIYRLKHLFIYKSKESKLKEIFFLQRSLMLLEGSGGNLPRDVQCDPNSRITAHMCRLHAGACLHFTCVIK